ncbi:Protein of unknown function, partial [Gryllus bimaculatus]
SKCPLLPPHFDCHF